MTKVKFGDLVSRVTKRTKIKKYTSPGEKEFVDYSLNQIEKSRSPYKYVEETALAEQEGSALASFGEDKLGLRGTKIETSAQKIAKVYGQEKGYLPQTTFDVPAETVSRQINKFETDILTRKLGAANKAYESIKKGNPAKYVKQRELLDFSKTHSPSQTLFVLRQRSKAAMQPETTTKGGFTAKLGKYAYKDIKYIPKYSGKGAAKTGHQLEEKLFKVQTKAIEFAKGQKLSLQKSLSEKGLIGKSESEPIPVQYLKSTSRFKKFMPAEVKAELGLQEYTGLPVSLSAWTRADHIKYENWVRAGRKQSYTAQEKAHGRLQNSYIAGPARAYNWKQEKQFISKIKTDPTFTKELMTRRRGQVKPGRNPERWTVPPRRKK